MHVIDLLALMTDVDKNTPIWLQTAAKPRRITGVAPLSADHPDRLVLTSAPAPAHALKRWELALLTQASDNRRRLIYADDGITIIPIFGFAFRDHVIELH